MDSQTTNIQIASSVRFVCLAVSGFALVTKWSQSVEPFVHHAWSGMCQLFGAAGFASLLHEIRYIGVQSYTWVIYTHILLIMCGFGAMLTLFVQHGRNYKGLCICLILCSAYSLHHGTGRNIVSDMKHALLYGGGEEHRNSTISMTPKIDLNENATTATATEPTITTQYDPILPMMIGSTVVVQLWIAEELNHYQILSLSILCRISAFAYHMLILPSSSSIIAFAGTYYIVQQLFFWLGDADEDD